MRRRLTRKAAMSTPPAPTNPHAFEHYELRLLGHLPARWADWFDGLTITHQPDGTTTLAGPIADQAALHGLLRKVRDLGLPLIAVNPVRPSQANAPASDPNSDHSPLT